MEEENTPHPDNMTKTKKWGNINSEINGPINQFSKNKINSNGTTFKKLPRKEFTYIIIIIIVHKNPSYAPVGNIYIYIYFFCKQLTTNKKKIPNFHTVNMLMVLCKQRVVCSSFL